MSWGRFSGAVLAGLVVASGAWAQQPDTYPTKIGFVYVQRALANTEEGKARLKDLDDWARPRQEELAALDKQVSDLKNDIMAKQGVASDDSVAELNRKFVVKRRELEDRQRAAKRDFEAKQQAILKDIGSKLQDVINKYADANHYTAVFILNPEQLAYMTPSADITDAVTKLYNDKYPLAAKAAAGPAK